MSIDQFHEAEAELGRLMEDTLPYRQVDTSDLDYGYPYRSALAVIPKGVLGRPHAEQTWLERVDDPDGDFLISLKLAQIERRFLRKTKLRDMGAVVLWMGSGEIEYNYLLGETPEHLMQSLNDFIDTVLAIQQAQNY